MNWALTIAALVCALIIIYLILRKDEVKKKSDEGLDKSFTEPTSQNLKHKERFHEYKDRDVKAIRPQGNQQRNLDRENGGLEEQEDVQQSSEKDVWDDRSDEIDRVGAIDQLGSTGKKSMVWRKKKEKMDAKKHGKANDRDDHKGSGKNYDSRSEGGFMTMVKARQDHGHEGGGRIM